VTTNEQPNLPTMQKRNDGTITLGSIFGGSFVGGFTQFVSKVAEWLRSLCEEVEHSGRITSHEPHTNVYTAHAARLYWLRWVICHKFFFFYNTFYTNFGSSDKFSVTLVENVGSKASKQPSLDFRFETLLL